MRFERNKGKIEVYRDSGKLLFRSDIYDGQFFVPGKFYKVLADAGYRPKYNLFFGRNYLDLSKIRLEKEQQ